MYQYRGFEDTIVAISTPPGQGGLGIVRLSGDRAITIADRMFYCSGSGQPSEFSSHTVHYGRIHDDGSILDEVLLTVMRSPRTYTTEDVIEISCHGGGVVLRSIVQLAVKHGARVADPGEFTRRAFLRGRIDLTQAEAVLDIIHARTEMFLKVSQNHLRGDLARELEEIRENLLGFYVELEAVVNFPEDDIDGDARDAITKRFAHLRERLARLVATSGHGRLLREGMRVVLCGKPNVGKSSLLNVFLKTPRAIVSRVAGTTRDTIEESAQIGGIPFQVIDTAGILEPRNDIEIEAVKRSRLNIERADLVLIVMDSSRPFDSDDEELLKHIHNPRQIIVYNKSDLPQRLDLSRVEASLSGASSVRVSATTRENVDVLEERIVGTVWQREGVDSDELMVTNVRHVQALRRAEEALARAEKESSEGLSYEFLSEEIKTAVNDLDAVTGRNVDADLLDTIFSKFCIGK